MNGVFQSTRSSASIQAFADQLVTFFKASDGVHGYGTKVVAKRFRSAGFKAGQDPTLDEFIYEVWKKHGSRGRGSAIAQLMPAASPPQG